ncbi:MAG: DedA family protein [Parachlamydiaceae bacterium]
MDCIFINEEWSYWMLNYGAVVLFVLLALGIVALPIPDETLLVCSGVFMSQGTFGIPTTILAALAGSICGITLSYIVGRTGGSYLVHKYGAKIGITEERLQRTHVWFEHYGKWTLTVGYFIPCVRHFTGISAGISGLEFPQFALFAYSGACFWVATFLSIGYFFGNICFSFLENLDMPMVAIASGVALLIALYFIIRRFQARGQ